jgi:hypothetical protein
MEVGRGDATHCHLVHRQRSHYSALHGNIGQDMAGKGREEKGGAGQDRAEQGSSGRLRAWPCRAGLRRAGRAAL